MNQDFEKAVYDALHKFETTSGVGSSATANEIIKVIKSYYKFGTTQERREILARIEKLRKEPGVPFPSNVEQMLDT
ncbi:hypothetical protein PU707_003809 [Cronobacter sakazakii]|uniref:hypothetical protein n=1 Tax=Cronobacter sakazakii TaxID=28141 RepID=UPI001AE35B79|nr:hypothetical protein [Cronobacter sakazakii]ELY2619868.1 hypothetical protein [Cronobacter malonaticus]ELY2743055.1 hypothetical protein [Cronobacter turicensis]EKK3979865.1 hypothetical protein [Cronobacter sakazakii]EKM6346099.1 hypothetical protein [Cronobacter sakazakii]EKM6351837.1 hypothetical protein [Cronobacter sakazakii]